MNQKAKQITQLVSKSRYVDGNWIEVSGRDVITHGTIMGFTYGENFGADGSSSGIWVGSTPGSKGLAVPIDSLTQHNEARVCAVSNRDSHIEIERLKPELQKSIIENTIAMLEKEASETLKRVNTFYAKQIEILELKKKKLEKQEQVLGKVPTSQFQAKSGLRPQGQSNQEI